MPDMPIDTVRSSLRDAHKAIQQQHQALKQPSSIDHAAMIRLAGTIQKLEEATSRDPSLKHEYSLLSDDFECLKIRVRILAQKNRVSARDAIFNQGQCRGIVGMIGSSLSFPQIATFNHVAKSCHAAKLQTVQNQLRAIRHLNVDSLDRYAMLLGKPGDWKAVLDLCQNLQEVSFTGSSLAKDDKKLLAIIEMLPESVRRVELSQTSSNCTTLMKLADHLPQLEALSLWDCPQVRTNGLTYLGQKCPRVILLSLGNLTISPTCFQSFSKLQKLCLNNVTVNIAQAAKYWTGLQLLSVYDGSIETPAAWHAIATHCPKLQQLTLQSETYYHGGCLDIVQKCPQISHLNMGFSDRHPGISDENLNELLPYCKNVTTFELHNALEPYRRNNDWLAFAAKHPSIANKMTKLEIIGPDENIRKTIALYPNVRHLTIKGETVSDTGITEIATRYKEQLTHVTVYDTAQTTFTDLGLDQLAQNCPRIDTLFIASNKQITVAGVRNLIERCPSLSRLTLPYSNIPQPMILALIKDYPDIRIKTEHYR